MREVERVTTTRTFSKGEVIYTPGETGEALFLLRSGKPPALMPCPRIQKTS